MPIVAKLIEKLPLRVLLHQISLATQRTNGPAQLSDMSRNPGRISTHRIIANVPILIETLQIVANIDDQLVFDRRNELIRFRSAIHIRTLLKR